MTQQTFDRLDSIYNRLEKLRQDMHTFIHHVQIEEDSELYDTYDLLHDAENVLGNYLDAKEDELKNTK